MNTEDYIKEHLTAIETGLAGFVAGIAAKRLYAAPRDWAGALEQLEEMKSILEGAAETTLAL